MRQPNLKYEKSLLFDWIHLKKLTRKHIPILKVDFLKKSYLWIILFGKYQIFLSQLIYKRNMNLSALPWSNFEFALPFLLAKTINLNILRSLQNHYLVQCSNKSTDPINDQFSLVFQRGALAKTDGIRIWPFFRDQINKISNRNKILNPSPKILFDREIEKRNVILRQSNKSVSINDTLFLSNRIRYKNEGFYYDLKIIKSQAFQGIFLLPRRSVLNLFSLSKFIQDKIKNPYFRAKNVLKIIKPENSESLSYQQLAYRSNTFPAIETKGASSGLSFIEDASFDNINVSYRNLTLFNNKSLYSKLHFSSLRQLGEKNISSKTNSGFSSNIYIPEQNKDLINKAKKGFTPLLNVRFKKPDQNLQSNFDDLVPDRSGASRSFFSNGYRIGMEEELFNHSNYQNRIFAGQDEPELIHPWKQKTTPVPSIESKNISKGHAQKTIQLARPIGITEPRRINPNSMPDVNQIAQEVYTIIEKTLRTERERRGIFS